MVVEAAYVLKCEQFSKRKSNAGTSWYESCMSHACPIVDSSYVAPRDQFQCRIDYIDHKVEEDQTAEAP